jgi:hypothetical protein
VALIDADSLAKTAENVNHAHLFDQKITKADARETVKWITARYAQDTPERIRNSAKPNPRWAKVPKSFNLTDADRRAKPKTFTGEPIANASLRTVHSREATRALFILGKVTGGPAPEALELCGTVHETASRLKAQGQALF